MKKYSHAWIAFMAIKRLEVIATTDNETVVKGVSEDVRKEAKALVRWFKNYRDFVIQGAWYPDEVFKDMSTSHIVKYQPTEAGPYTTFGKLPTTHSIYELMRKSSPLYNKPYKCVAGNCADRCESISHSIVDNFKMLHREDRGCPIATTGNHIAMRFFILSHYIADCHMPLHCDCRSFSTGANIHGFIESEWDKQVKKSYRIDTPNNRFFYAPDGYPLPDKVTPLMQAVEDDAVNREYLHSWGTGNSSTWDYMSALSEYSYLMAYRLIPAEYKDTELTKEIYKTTEAYARLEEYSRIILSDSVDSIARIWLHVWARYRKWAAGR